MSLLPQAPYSFGPPGGPAPLSGSGLGLAAAALAVASFVASIFKEIAARWRGIVIAHVFFLTLWMAIQVFFFATGAHWCLPSNGSTFAMWLTKSFGPVARCGPVTQATSSFQGSTAMAAPAPAPALTPPQLPAAVPASTRVSPPGAPPQPSAGVSHWPPASGAASNWSAKTIANCWRNRAVDSGDCYETVDSHRRAPPPRYRYPEQPRPAPTRCRRPYDCWPGDSWRNDL